MDNKNLLNERHRDLVHMTIRARISIDGNNDPTVLDIMTDMRAIPGIVTVRQTQPVSEPINAEEKRLIELVVSYIPKYIRTDNIADDPIYVCKSLKKVDGVDIIRVMTHDNAVFNQKTKRRPIIV